MAAAIPGFTPTIPPSSTSASKGNKALSSSDFMNLMIQQLSQQDPLNPTDSNQLLTQMSQISNLQSNTDMQKNLQGLTLQQSIGAGGNLIGKTVGGLDQGGNKISGIVTSVKVADQQVYLELDSGKELPMSNVTGIAVTSPADGVSSLAANASNLSNFAALAQSNPMLSQLLANSSGSSLSNLSSLASLLSSLGK